MELQKVTTWKCSQINNYLFPWLFGQAGRVKVNTTKAATFTLPLTFVWPSFDLPGPVKKKRKKKRWGFLIEARTAAMRKEWFPINEISSRKRWREFFFIYFFIFQFKLLNGFLPQVWIRFDFFPPIFWTPCLQKSNCAKCAFKWDLSGSENEISISCAVQYTCRQIEWCLELFELGLNKRQQIWFVERVFISSLEVTASQDGLGSADFRRQLITMQEAIVHEYKKH